MKKSSKLIFFWIIMLGSCGPLAPVSLSDSSQLITPTVTITSITVNTLTVINTPTSSSIPPSTSTRDSRPTTTLVPAPTYIGTMTLMPTSVSTLQNPPTRDSAVDFPVGLILDEWELSKDSSFDKSSFVPVIGTREQLLERYDHIGDIFHILPNPLIQGFYNMVSLDGKKLEVIEENYDVTKTIIKVYYDGKEISRIDAGRASADSKVWGLWTYEDHWILEYKNVFENSYDGYYFLGNIIWDGESLNEKYSYQESFGLTAINGRILYFFKRNDQVGISYNGEEFDLGYESVHHYVCCYGISNANPGKTEFPNNWNQNRLYSFFATRDGKNYYVVIWKQ